MSVATGKVLFEGELMADYFQVYLQDDDGTWSLPDNYSDDALRQRVIISARCLLIHTARNMIVPVRIELHVTRPAIEVDAFQHVIEAGFCAPSGRLVVAGLTDDVGKASRITVPVGQLGALVTFQGLDTLDEFELAGEDRYTVHLWPGTVEPGIRVLRAYPVPSVGTGP